MLRPTEVDKLDWEISNLIDELPLDPTVTRHLRLRTICLSYGTPVDMSYGLSVPDPEISLRLLDVTARKLPEIDWLSRKLSIDEILGCWALALTSEKDSQGRARYPVLNSHSFGARKMLAHRFVVTSLSGPLKPAGHLDHVCRNHACCNPSHLDIVSHTVNVRRGFLARTAITGQLPLQ